VVKNLDFSILLHYVWKFICDRPIAYFKLIVYVYRNSYMDFQLVQKLMITSMTCFIIIIIIIIIIYYARWQHLIHKIHTKYIVNE